MNNVEPKSLYEFEGQFLLGYWAKGHHDPLTFCEAIKEFENVDINPSQVEHKYWRIVNNQVVDTKPGRGAFPVTYVDIE